MQGAQGVLELKLEENETLLTRRIEEDGKVNLVVSRTDANGGTEDIIRNVGQVKIINFQSPQYLRRVGMAFILMVALVDLAGRLDNPLPATGSNGKSSNMLLSYPMINQ